MTAYKHVLSYWAFFILLYRCSWSPFAVTAAELFPHVQRNTLATPSQKKEKQPQTKKSGLYGFFCTTSF